MLLLLFVADQKDDGTQIAGFGCETDEGTGTILEGGMGLTGPFLVGDTNVHGLTSDAIAGIVGTQDRAGFAHGNHGTPIANVAIAFGLQDLFRR